MGRKRLGAVARRESQGGFNPSSCLLGVTEKMEPDYLASRSNSPYASVSTLKCLLNQTHDQLGHLFPWAVAKRCLSPSCFSTLPSRDLFPVLLLLPKAAAG